MVVDTAFSQQHVMRMVTQHMVFPVHTVKSHYTDSGVDHLPTQFNFGLAAGLVHGRERGVNQSWGRYFPIDPTQSCLCRRLNTPPPDTVRHDDVDRSVIPAFLYLPGHANPRQVSRYATPIALKIRDQIAPAFPPASLPSPPLSM